MRNLIAIAFLAPLLAVASDDLAKQQAWIERGQDAVRALLKDPESARFDGDFFHRGADNVPMACGWVNAKNGFGGYTGKTRYISAGQPDLTFLESSVADFDTVWRRFCTN